MANNKSPAKHFFDQSFQGKEKQLAVHIQLSKNRLYLAYFYPSNSSYVGIEEHFLGEHQSWYQAIPTIDKKLDTIGKHYKSYSIAIIDESFSLIPQPLFSKDAMAAYLNLNHRQKEEEQSYHYNTIDSANTVIAFAIPLQLTSLLQKHFTSYRILHYASPLLEYGEIIKPSIKEELQLHIQADHFEVIHYKLGKLRLFNTYAYQSTEDFIYFLLYVMEQFNIDRTKVPLKIFGELEENSALYKIIYKYINDFTFAATPKELNFSTVLSKLPEHYYRNLYNQYLCE